VREVLSVCESLGLWAVIFTNGTVVDAALAEELKTFPVSIVAKLHALDDAETADWLAGQTGAHDHMMAGIGSLLSHSWTEDKRLGCEAIIVRRNAEQLPAMWRWMRQHGIIPYFESPKRVGRARSMEEEEFLTPSEMGDVFSLLQEIDRREFNIDWLPKPPIAALGCDKWHYALYVSGSGDVYPCSGVFWPLGDLGRQTLKEIVESPVCRTVREVNSHLKGRCGDCVWNSCCYGCRADAYALTGDPFAEDAGCWFWKPMRASGADAVNRADSEDEHE